MLTQEPFTLKSITTKVTFGQNIFWLVPVEINQSMLALKQSMLKINQSMFKIKDKEEFRDKIVCS